MPDDSFPNPKIVYTILQCLDLIETDDADEVQLKKLESTLKVYQEECKSSGYDECKTLIGKILDKWYSKSAMIKTDYRDFGGIHDNQRNFENLIKSQKKRHREENDYDDEDDEEPVIKKRQKKIGGSEGLQSSSGSGLTKMERLQRDSEGFKGGNTQQKDVFKKLLNSLKKGKKKTATKSKMHTVKLDF